VSSHLDVTPQRTRAIEEFAASGAFSVDLAHGTGDSHAYAIHFAPGGVIGPHPAGFDQLFLVVQGSGWVAGADGVRLSIRTHCGAFVPRGEIHSKGREVGMLALILQASTFSLAERK
jgi:quercetin dioxygenase-like cupin family protein